MLYDESDPGTDAFINSEVMAGNGLASPCDYCGAERFEPCNYDCLSLVD